MSLTLKDRDLVEQAHKLHPNHDNSPYGFIKQGRGYFKLGLDKLSAKYPNDTWVGSFRSLGWHLEKLQIEEAPELTVPQEIKVGNRCKFNGVEHQIYAFGDGYVLLSPARSNYVYHDTVAAFEELEQTV